MYQISFDPPRQLISVELGGLFSVAEVDHYIAELRSGFLRHHFRAGYLMLIDTSACRIQPQDVLVSLGGHMASFPKARRLAVVTGDSLARMQVRRIMKQSYLRIVDTVPEAEQWLFAPAVDEEHPAATAAA